MTTEFLTLNLPDLETLIAKSNCSCHFINPNKTRIILWKDRSSNSESSQKEVKENEEVYYLRIGIQKFISYPLKDKNKALYWRFNPWELEKKERISTSELAQTKVEESTINPDPHNPVTKYQSRLQKTEALNHGKSTSSSEHSESTSH